jgi:UDP-N-acetylmuramoylalanine--D-glutamate ligase
MELNLKNKKILVLGLGESGFYSAIFLRDKGAKIIVNDIKDKENFTKIIPELEKRGIDYIFGCHPKEIVKDIDYIIISPGIPKHNPIYQEAKRFNIKIISELELAYIFSKVPIIAITGTKGKSTTTTLIGEILKKAGFKVIVSGNIGIPFIKNVENLDTGFFVLEVSSFQLEDIESFRPYISLFINFYPDHMDRYSTIEEYKNAKLNIFKNQRDNDWAIGFYDQEEVRRSIEILNINKAFFSLYELKEEGIFLKDNRIIYRVNKNEGFFELPIKGIWNKNLLLNFMAGALVGLILNIKPDIIREVGEEFKGIPYALEKIAEIKKRIFINDSKATNPISTISAIRSLHNPILLILGGRNKNFDFTELFSEIKNSNVKKIYLIGETREIMENLAKKFNIPYLICEDFEYAVRSAYFDSSEMDIILLSPACASFDMFSDYKERGEIFTQIVNKIKNEEE